MLKSTRNDIQALRLSDSVTPPDAIQLHVIERSSSVTSSSSASEDDGQTLLRLNSASKSPTEKLPLSQPKSSLPPTKVLFLDGVRGLAAVLVVVQHSHAYIEQFNLGGVAVDTFFVLSSFLLTWLFMKKSMKLLSQGASPRSWMFALADYFSKRFFRVYPLFAVVVIALSFMSFKDQHRYYLVRKPEAFDLFQTLTFDIHHRQFVLWTLPLEISYYFVIPVFVLAMLGMRRYWWVAAAPIFAWTVYKGWYEYRMHHMPLMPHLPTFLSGSIGAVVFVKLDAWMKETGFKFRWWHTVAIRVFEYAFIAVLLSVCFKGLLFDWVLKNPAPDTKGARYVSALLTAIFVVEMIRPSCVSTMFEWSVLRYCGKISFSIYLLHIFVLRNPTISSEPKYMNRLVARGFLIFLLATVSYYLVEYPSQLMAQRISKFLAAREARERDGLVRFSCMDRIKFSKLRTNSAGK